METDWADKITQAMTNGVRQIVKAITYTGKKYRSASNPPVLGCSDSNDYVVKGQQVGRSLVNDYVVGILGKRIESPVGEVVIVDVPQELIAIEDEIGHIPPGLSLGSLHVTECTGKSWVANHSNENSPRFARLIVLFGWAGVTDIQFIYKTTKPNLVFSVDHGHLISQSPDWTIEILENSGPAEIDANLLTECNVPPDILATSFDSLRQVTMDDIALAVSAPPADWSITIEERIAMATYLERRREELLSSSGY